MSPCLSEASPVEGILTSLEVGPLSLSKITLVSLCMNFTWRGFPMSALCLMTLVLLAVRFCNFIIEEFFLQSSLFHKGETLVF